MTLKLYFGLSMFVVASMASAFYVMQRENHVLRRQAKELQNELRYLPRPAEARPLLRAAVQAGASRPVNQPPEAQPLVLDLAIDEALFARYRAILETCDGDVVWVGENLKPRGRIVAAEIPGGVIDTRDYILRLSGTSTTSTEPVAEFAFHIQASH